ncbi:hypothetical protein [Kribbella soli]|uniref:Uncharacterized protein n=1 Tax=Kribbella soli TaxID=1124743 RepID=A0A4R0HH38_9ACTN|nr:hypothetical protein [Kribbella soli]TCC10607.1 hypothetical protein E0H45_04660 [Kribbella soli]
MNIAAAAMVILGVVLVISLVFVGFKWVKPESLRLSVKWNSLEFELRREQPPEAPKALEHDPHP